MTGTCSKRGRTAGGYLFASYLQDAQNKVVQYDYDGKLVRESRCPPSRTVGASAAKGGGYRTLLLAVELHGPGDDLPLRHRYGRVDPLQGPEVAFDPSLFVTEQVFYASKDGTQVPMFITHRKGHEAQRQESLSALRVRRLQINMTPGFNPRR